MSFRDGNWQARYGSMGDEAEGVFEAVYEAGFVRFGLNRPPIGLRDMPPKLRYTPDYLTAKGLVEVQGHGRDSTIKLKVEKYGALLDWGRDWRVDLFLWDSAHKEYGWLRLTDLSRIVNADHTDYDTFNDGKAFIRFDRSELPIEWVKLDE